MKRVCRSGSPRPGASCIFQPFAQANNPELGEEDYNPKEPVSWISYLDFNAMYPAATTLPMPNGPCCVAVALPEENAARQVSYLLLGLGSPRAHEGREGPVRAAHRGAPRPLSVALREARALPWHARRGGRGRQAAQVPAERAGRQGLEAAQGLPLRLQPLHGGFMELKHSETAGSVVAEKVVEAALHETFRAPTNAARSFNPQYGDAQRLGAVDSMTVRSTEGRETLLKLTLPAPGSGNAAGRLTRRRPASGQLPGASEAQDPTSL